MTQQHVQVATERADEAPKTAPLTSTASTDPAAAARWEFNNRKNLLYALVGYDFGMDPESRLDEIRAYKKNEAKYLVDSLKLNPRDRVVDLGSGCGFISRVVALLCERIFASISVGSSWIFAAKKCATSAMPSSIKSSSET